jgi:hypothetical protein
MTLKWASKIGRSLPKNKTNSNFSQSCNGFRISSVCWQRLTVVAVGVVEVVIVVVVDVDVLDVVTVIHVMAVGVILIGL